MRNNAQIPPNPPLEKGGSSPQCLGGIPPFPKGGLGGISSWRTPPTHLPFLNPTALHLWRANLSLSKKQLRTLHSCLSHDEKARAARFKFPIHQQRFTAARGLLRHILAHYINQNPADILFDYSEHGKPSLAVATHSDVCFNLSHSHEWAIYAITQAPVGIDIEHIRPLEAGAIAQRFFSAYENKQLQALPTHALQSAFFQTWVCKEAFIKAIGNGLSFPLKDFSIDVTENPPRLVAVNHDEHAAKTWHFLTINPAHEYVGAIATGQKIVDTYLWDANTLIQTYA